MSAISTLAQAVDNRLNPIVVKELRQAVQSKFVTVMILLLLVGQVTIIGLWMLFDEHIATRITAGREMFMVLLGMLVAVSSLLVPLYTGVRFAFERSDTNMALLYGTTISPWAIIRGKFFCAAVVAAIIYGACMPFIVLTYLLRGVDVPTILLALTVGYMVLLAVTALTIFLASPRLALGWRIVLGLVAAGSIVVSVGTVIGISSSPLRGMGMMMGSWKFWAGFMTFAAIWAAFIVLCLQCAVAVISPPLSNRTRPIRIAVTSIVVVCGVIALAWSDWGSRIDVMFGWLIPVMILLCLAMLVAISERDHLSLRVARTVPRSMFWRPLAMLYFSGWAGGVLWILLTGAACLGAVWIMATWVWPWVSAAERISEKLASLLGIFLYVYAYCMSALLLTRTVLKGPMAPSRTWILAILIGAMCNVLPLLVGFMVSSGSWWNVYEEGLVLLGGPMCLADQGVRDYGLVVSIAWSIVVTMACVPLFKQQFVQFKPPVDAIAEPAKVQADAAELP